MSFEAPLVTDMTPVDDPPRIGAHGGGQAARQQRGGGGWQGNDDEHPDVSYMLLITIPARGPSI